VRVTATEVRVFVNRHEVAVLAIAAGDLDGSPGVHIGAGGDVLVSGITVERPWSAQ
jgi:hypothetical protein